MSENTTAPAEETPADERSERLERIVRSMGRESLELTRAMQEVGRNVDSASARVDAMDLNLKEVLQTLWKAVQDNQAGIRAAEEHYAGALRELEARIQDELRLHLYRSCLQAVVPALDDLDLVIAHERNGAAGEVEEGSVLEALLLVRSKLLEGLRALGLEEIPVEPLVSMFDPAVHQVSDRDVPEGFLPDADVPRGTVLFRRRTGFLLNGRVLRAAQVIVRT